MSLKSVAIIEPLKQPNSAGLLQPIMEQQGSQKQLINYGIHMHPMTQLTAPDLLDRDRNSMFDIICSILYTSLPLILSLQLNYFTSVINIIFIGNYGDMNMFSGIGLATFIVNIFGFMVIQNISVGFSVVCSYFVNKAQIGYLYQKTLGINFFTCILITPILYLGQKAMLAVGFNEQMTKLSGIYMWALVPSFYLYAFYDTTRNYLLSQQVIYPSLVISSTMSFLHCLIAYVFIYQWELGLTGAAWAKNITQGLNCLTIYLYIIYKQPTKQSWIQWDIKSTNNIHKFLKVVLTHEVFLYFEVVSFQILGFIACYLAIPQQICAHIVLATVFFVSFFICQGICFCVNKAISVSIQEDDISGAKKKTNLAIFLIALVTGLIALNLITRKSDFIQAFIQNQQIIRVINQNFWIFLMALIGDGFHNVFLGLIKTLQVKRYWQITMVSSYIVGLGSAIILAFEFKWGIYGIWFGWLIAIGINLLFQLQFMIGINWEAHFQFVRKKYKLIYKETRLSKKQISTYGDLK